MGRFGGFEGGVLMAAGFALLGSIGCSSAADEPGSGGGSVVPIDPARFLENSASCTMTDGTGNTTTARWDAPSRTLEQGNLYWKLDENLLVVEYGQLDHQWRHQMTYDEHHTLVTFVYEWEGLESPENSFDQTNRYDDARLLLESELSYHAGRRVVRTYSREPSELTERWREESAGRVFESFTKTLYQGSLAMERQYDDGGTGPSRREVVTRDEAGRPTRLDIDGGGFVSVIDGTADLRTQWTFDGDGRLTLHQQDGTEAFDAPVVDGVWDEETRYGPGCEAAAVLPVELYRIPEWVLGP